MSFAEKKKTTSIKTHWIYPIKPGNGARYKQIVNMVTAAIDAGELLPGDRMPTQRELAEMLKVDLTTVTRAYNELRERNLTQAASGRGSFISYQPDTLSHIDLSMNTPPGSAKILPLISRSLERLQSSIDAESLMTYHVGAGSQVERSAAVKWLKPLLGEFDSQRVVACPGAQTAISALLSLLTKPGDVVVTDELTYPGFISAARQHNLQIVTVAADEQGMDPDGLIHVCKTYGAKVVYLNPTIHNPTALTISDGRRKAIAEALTAHNLTLIEDDPYGLLPDEPPAPIATLAPRNTWYVSTLSKCLTPGVRVAWVICPESTSWEPLAGVIRANVLIANPLMLAVTADWINSGAAMELLQELRQENAQRVALANSILPGKIISSPFGLHVWLAGEAGFDPHSLVHSAAKVGLGITPSYVFSPVGGVLSGIRISLGGARDLSQLANALQRLNNVLKSASHTQVGGGYV
ncbi:GntR family transcriptional regulator [Pantoea coffeiphila]|uniref:GntR family transcriptional regulator n=1 Tax=Pantoea coffeiphila TaxID=1465635 RepID=A0A2S9IF61_9GAMM|nr:GntR family transcriptional regulator [Pantoea coffeiphila]